MDAVKRYEELRKTLNMTDAITQLQVDILEDQYQKHIKDEKFCEACCGEIDGEGSFTHAKDCKIKILNNEVKALQEIIYKNDNLKSDMYLRERLGKIVRSVWIKWAKEQPHPKESWLVDWNALSESDKEVDRRIGETIWSIALPSSHSLCQEETKEEVKKGNINHENTI
jgi:hypothetical protein